MGNQQVIAVGAKPWVVCVLSIAVTAVSHRAHSSSERTLKCVFRYRLHRANLLWTQVKPPAAISQLHFCILSCSYCYCTLYPCVMHPIAWCIQNAVNSTSKLYRAALFSLWRWLRPRCNPSRCVLVRRFVAIFSPGPSSKLPHAQKLKCTVPSPLCARTDCRLVYPATYLATWWYLRENEWDSSSDSLGPVEDSLLGQEEHIIPYCHRKETTQRCSFIIVSKPSPGWDTSAGQ